MRLQGCFKVKEALEYVGDAGIPWQFMRDGEDYDDVESDETDNIRVWSAEGVKTVWEKEQ